MAALMAQGYKYGIEISKGKSKMFSQNMNKFHLVLAIAAIAILPSCASSPSQQAMSGDVMIADPFEGANRAVFKFNNVVDDAIIHPVAKTYNVVLPSPAKKGVKNFLRNLKSPVTFANQALQGDVGGATDAVVRALVNTTVGIGGLIDVADKIGFKYEQEDFGQTMAVWGVPHGAYVVAPFLGPSSLRDYAGYFVDGYADPLRHYLFNINEEEWHYARMALSYVQLRADFVNLLEDLERSSIDYYASVRSTYYQNRESLIRDKDPDVVGGPSADEFDDF